VANRIRTGWATTGCDRCRRWWIRRDAHGGSGGKAPSDAVVLFDGKALSAWVAMDGSPTRWVVKDGYMECVSGSGYVRTLQNFGDCQLHIEWCAPTPVEGEGQGRGNSGFFSA